MCLLTMIMAEIEHVSFHQITNAHYVMGATKDLFAANQKLPMHYEVSLLCLVCMLLSTNDLYTESPWFYRKSLASSGMWAVQNICG